MIRKITYDGNPLTSAACCQFSSSHHGGFPRRLSVERSDLAFLYMITYSVLRLPARRTEPSVGIPSLESAAVSVKRVELNRAPRRLGYGR
jgi:hypothetical protein